MLTVSMKDLIIMLKNQFQSHTMTQNRKECTVDEIFREICSQLLKKDKQNLEKSLMRVKLKKKN